MLAGARSLCLQRTAMSRAERISFTGALRDVQGSTDGQGLARGAVRLVTPSRHGSPARWLTDMDDDVVNSGA